jgi:hypothetical protein
MRVEEMEKNWAELAKKERKAVSQRDKTSHRLKPNVDYEQGTGDMKSTTREIINLAKKGMHVDKIVKRMSFKGLNRDYVLQALWRHEDKWKK